MPSLSFTGRSIVETLHLSLPEVRILPVVSKGIDDASGEAASNLVVHGDNLLGLKALVRDYAGRIDCIYGDPPYNTGNRGWRYNDNLESPTLRDWFETSGVAAEFEALTTSQGNARTAPERHDKWMAMMWPRLKLMHELLSERGVLFLSIDDDEHHRLRLMLDEIFGAKNFVASIVWKKKYAPQNDARWLSDMHEYIVVYAKSKDSWRPNGLPRTERQDKAFKNPDNDPRGPWKASDLSVKTVTQSCIYPITTPSGRVVMPPKGTAWRVSSERFAELVADDRIWFGKTGGNVPALKRFLTDVRSTRVPETFWHHDEVGHTDASRKEIKAVFAECDRPFDTPKPLALLERIVALSTTPQSIVLDPFAGSGTTAHAVLATNAADGGSRRFIMLECEDYADEITAERLRRVIRGVPTMKDPRFSAGYPGAGFSYARLETERD